MHAPATSGSGYMNFTSNSCPPIFIWYQKPVGNISYIYLRKAVLVIDKIKFTSLL
jgi:hypothetical protein